MKSNVTLLYHELEAEPQLQFLNLLTIINCTSSRLDNGQLWSGVYQNSCVTAAYRNLTNFENSATITFLVWNEVTFFIRLWTKISNGRSGWSVTLNVRIFWKHGNDKNCYKKLVMMILKAYARNFQFEVHLHGPSGVACLWQKTHFEELYNKQGNSGDKRNIFISN